MQKRQWTLNLITCLKRKPIANTKRNNMVEQGTQRYQSECVVPENNHTFLKDGFVVFFLQIELCKFTFLHPGLHFTFTLNYFKYLYFT